MNTAFKSTTMSDPHKPVPHNLAMLHKGESAIVTGLMPIEDDEDHALQMRLLELGFAPGEAVRVIAESFPGRDPMAVRVGNTTFALRRREASMIRIAKDLVREKS